MINIVAFHNLKGMGSGALGASGGEIYKANMQNPVSLRKTIKQKLPLAPP